MATLEIGVLFREASKERSGRGEPSCSARSRRNATKMASIVE